MSMIANALLSIAADTLAEARMKIEKRDNRIEELERENFELKMRITIMQETRASSRTGAIMTPEQCEELKAAAQEKIRAKAESVSDYFTISQAFDDLATPETVLSLIAQVEALTVPQGDASAAQQGWDVGDLISDMRVEKEVGKERANLRGEVLAAQADAIMGFAHAMEEIGMFDVGLMTLAAGTAARIRGLVNVPTIPAIPGTKEGA